MITLILRSLVEKGVSRYEAITLEEAAVTVVVVGWGGYEQSSPRIQTRSVSQVRRVGWHPGGPPTVTVYWDETLVATWGAQRNILHITGRERAQPVIKWSVAAAVGGRDVWGN